MDTNHQPIVVSLESWHQSCRFVMFWTRAATLYHVCRTPQVDLKHNHRVGGGTKDAIPDVVGARRSGNVNSRTMGDVPIPKMWDILERDAISLQEIGYPSAEGERKVRDRNQHVTALRPLTTLGPIGRHGPEWVSLAGSRRKKSATSPAYRQHSGYLY